MHIVYSGTPESAGTYSPAGEGQASLVLLVRVHHAQLHCQLSVGVGDQRVGEGALGQLAVGLREGLVHKHFSTFLTEIKVDITVKWIAPILVH